jgi:DNA-binding SARP family transcriptional activator
MYPNMRLHREAIIDVLWESAPPATAVNQVQAHVSRLRRILDPGGGQDGLGCPLESSGTSYMLRATTGQLDSLAFQDLGERARQARERGDLFSACGLYDRALRLWRGDPLAEMDLLRGSDVVADLARQRTDLIVAYSDAAFEAALHDRVVPHLRALAAREPLNEKAHARLMIALARTGQQAAALGLFDDLRRRLDEQLGVYPGPELADAHECVLQHDFPPLVEGASSSAASCASAASAGSPAASAGRAAAWSGVGLRAIGRFPVRQLPPAPPDFTGRTAEVGSLTSLLAPAPGRIGVPVAVISGPPGVGKTALALQVAHLTRHLFPDGQLHVELAGSTRLARDPGDVLGELLRACGVHGSALPDSAAERAALFRSQVAGQHMLVMADDATSAEQVRPLLPGTAGCAVIVTSRSRLGVLAGAQLHCLDPLPHVDAVRMLARIVGSQRVADEADASDNLVRACGCLPLASDRGRQARHEAVVARSDGRQRGCRPTATA